MLSAQVIRTAGFDTTTTTWGPLKADGSFDLTLAVAAGDWVEAGLSMLAPNAAVFAYLDVATMVSGSPRAWVSNGDLNHSAAASGWFKSNAFADLPMGGSNLYKVEAGDIVAGVVTFRAYGMVSSGTGSFYATTTDPAAFYVVQRTGTASAPAQTAFVGAVPRI